MQACLNPIRWLDITAHDARKIQFSQCVRSWGGDDCVLCIVPLEEACELSLSMLWNLPAARRAREQTRRDGFALWCAGCPKMGTLPDVDVEQLAAANQWTHINLAYDRTCNLACPSCRPRKWTTHRRDSEMLLRFQDKLIKPLLRHAEWAYLAGLGDPFGSPAYRRLLMDLQPDDVPLLNWHIQTNGIGFTPEAYGMIPTRRQVVSVQVSVDAATEATYRENRGGDWRQLMSNLDFLAGLRSDELVRQFCISFVVQANNWLEMEAFVELGESLGVDAVLFNALLDQGTYKPGEYQTRAIHLPEHSEHVNAMAAIERLANNPSVRVEIPRRAA